MREGEGTGRRGLEGRQKRVNKIEGSSKGRRTAGKLEIERGRKGRCRKGREVRRES